MARSRKWRSHPKSGGAAPKSSPPVRSERLGRYGVRRRRHERLPRVRRGADGVRAGRLVHRDAVAGAGNRHGSRVLPAGRDRSARARRLLLGHASPTCTSAVLRGRCGAAPRGGAAGLGAVGRVRWGRVCSGSSATQAAARTRHRFRKWRQCARVLAAPQSRWVPGRQRSRTFVWPPRLAPTSHASMRRGFCDRRARGTTSTRRLAPVRVVSQMPGLRYALDDVVRQVRRVDVAQVEQRWRPRCAAPRGTIRCSRSRRRSTCESWLASALAAIVRCHVRSMPTSARACMSTRRQNEAGVAIRAGAVARSTTWRPSSGESGRVVATSSNFGAGYSRRSQLRSRVSSVDRGWNEQLVDRPLVWIR